MHVPGVWIVESVATRPEFRRRGLVDALMQEIMERGRTLMTLVLDGRRFIDGVLEGDEVKAEAA